MPEKTFYVDIVSPSRNVFSGEVISLSAPGTCGGFQILHNHTEFLTTFKIGEIKLVIDKDTTHYYATSGGIIEVNKNHVIVLAETIERADEIDEERAKAALENAEKKLREKAEDINLLKVSIALEKARNRLRILERQRLMKR